MKGIYVLIILVTKNIIVNVGALGKIIFELGLYAYVGSAQNSLEKRVERHVGRAKRKFWHIDYLLNNNAAKVSKVFYREAGKPEECKVSRRMGSLGHPIRGFGSSDCSCESHLFKIDNYDFLRESMYEVNAEPVPKRA